MEGKSLLTPSPTRFDWRYDPLDVLVLYRWTLPNFGELFDLLGQTNDSLQRVMLWNRLALSNMHSAHKCFRHARWMLHMTRMNVVQRQDTGQQLSRLSALGPWWTWCAVTLHSASASSARRRGSSWQDEHSGHDCPEPFQCGRHQLTGGAPYSKKPLKLPC